MYIYICMYIFMYVDIYTSCLIISIFPNVTERTFSIYIKQDCKTNNLLNIAEQDLFLEKIWYTHAKYTHFNLHLS